MIADASGETLALIAASPARDSGAKGGGARRFYASSRMRGCAVTTRPPLAATRRLQAASEGVGSSGDRGFSSRSTAGAASCKPRRCGSPLVERSTAPDCARPNCVVAGHRSRTTALSDPQGRKAGRGTGGGPISDRARRRGRCLARSPAGFGVLFPFGRGIERVSTSPTDQRSLPTPDPPSDQPALRGMRLHSPVERGTCFRQTLLGRRRLRDTKSTPMWIRAASSSWSMHAIRSPTRVASAARALTQGRGRPNRQRRMASYLDFEKPLAELEARIAELRETSSAGEANIEAEIRKLEDRAERTLRDLYGRLTPGQKAHRAHPERPHFKDYVAGLIEFRAPRGRPWFGGMRRSSRLR